jgi:hypothetical protein
MTNSNTQPREPKNGAEDPSAHDFDPARLAALADLASVLISIALSRVEANAAKSEGAWERSQVFTAAARLYQLRGHSIAAQRAHWQAKLFLFQTTTRRERGTGTTSRRFRPFIQYRDGSEDPDAAAFTNDAVDLFSDLMLRSSHPALRTRYADFVWERRRDFRAAQQAVGAYLGAAELYISTERAADLEQATDPLIRGFSRKSSPNG